MRQDLCKIEIVRHKPSPTTPSTRKISSESSYSQTIRPKQSAKNRHPRFNQTPDRLNQGSYRPSLSAERNRESQNSCLNTIFHKEREYQEFAEKCFSYLSKKRLGDEEKPNSFSTMLHNIKKSIREAQRQAQRHPKEESKQQEQQQLICVRSQIHQIYSHDQKMQLYKMIKSTQARPRRNSNTTQTLDPSGRYTQNPFQYNRNIICFTMALNQPQVHKKPLVQVPQRTASTSVGKRVVTIGRTQPKAMRFQLSGDADSQYTRKLKNFLDFLFKINYSNNIYVPFEIGKVEEAAPRFKAYVGRGNNSLLLKSLIKRRFWWEVVDQEPENPTSVHFYWTQNIVDVVHAAQKIAPSLSPQQQTRLSRKKQEEEGIQLNRKILNSDKSETVEQLISREGYVVPFQKYSPDLMSNHLPRNYCIGSKKNLFRSLDHYFRTRKKNPFEFIPRTYHIRSADCPQFRQFVKQNQGELDRVWIVKPGENSNRGNGISLSTFRGISGKLRRAKHQNGQAVTYIVQSYINRPFLYCGRKFDIRHYLLLTSVNGLLKAYWYRDGYIRTSSELFDLEDLDNPFIHLTNDAIQRKSEDYQKYQPANKLSYSQFQRYLDYAYPAKNYSFERDVLPRMKQLAVHIVRANAATIDHRRHANNFEIFGLDFMLDRDFKTWLIQVNYNPCLEVNCPVLERIIPAMVQSSFRVALDPLFPPHAHFPPARRHTLADHYLRNLRYELIYDQESALTQEQDYGFVQEREQEEEYLDEGKEADEILI